MQQKTSIAIASFEAKYPGWKVEHIPVGGYDEVKSKVVSDLTAGLQPDLAYCYPDHVAQYLQTSKVVDLNKYMTSDEKIQIKDENGNVTEIFATYDPDSKGGDPADGRKVKGATIHWVDAATAVGAEVRLYDNLFTDADPDAGDKNFLDCLNPGSLEVLTGAKVEAGLANVEAPASFHFLRQAYFCADNKDSKPGHLVFNRSVSLKDSFKF